MAKQFPFFTWWKEKGGTPHKTTAKIRTTAISKVNEVKKGENGGQKQREERIWGRKEHLSNPISYLHQIRKNKRVKGDE